jgi:hypothetical protein
MSAAIAALSIGDAEARSPAEDRLAVVALENQWLTHESDAAALDSILADDFSHPVGAGVILTKQQHIAWASTHPAPQGTRWAFDALGVRLYGDMAIANGVVRRTSPQGEEQRSIFTDVFVYRDGRWQAVNAQENVVAP